MKKAYKFQIGKMDEKRAKRRKRLAIVFSLLFGIPLLSLAIAAGGFAIWADKADFDPSLLPTATAIPAFYDAYGNELSYLQSAYISPEEVPDVLKYAFVALEDKRFFKHNGYDAVRMAGATLKNLKARKVVEGASTITQQLVKNTHLTHQRTLKRKLTEIAIARKIEEAYSKDEIMAMYLSVIYFGAGNYGVKAAAEDFFGKRIGELSVAECATLAAIVKSPAGYSPKNHPDKCKTRRDMTLDLMKDQGYIDEETAKRAKEEELTVARKKEESNIGKLFVSLARDEVCARLGLTKYQLDNSGLKIYTSLDPAVQAALERERENSLNFEGENVNSVAVVLDSQAKVLGYSSDYAYQIRRQAGSTLKPLAVYAPAFDKKIVSLSTPVVDERIDYGGFSPDNFAGKFYGQTNVKEAIKRSMNSVSVKVLDYLGVDESRKYLSLFGIEPSEDDNSYALALGSLSKGVTPLELAGGYCALANGGNARTPSFIRYAVDGDKKLLETTDIRSAVSEAGAALTSIALKDAVKDGTAKALSVLPFEVAAKTGTAARADGKNSDGWIAAYNDSCTVVVWHGNDMGMTERGGGYPAMHAARIWQSLWEVMDMSKEMKTSDSIKSVVIDEYSTNAMSCVVAANENTPIEYQKTEYFDVANLPEHTSGSFDAARPAEFEIDISFGKVWLSFETEEIYCYELYRTDALGRELLIRTSGGNLPVSVCDSPIGLGSRVTYELVCSLLCRPELSATTQKGIFYEAYGYADNV